jgi:hypothetical protein
MSATSPTRLAALFAQRGVHARFTKEGTRSVVVLFAGLDPAAALKEGSR